VFNGGCAPISVTAVVAVGHSNSKSIYPSCKKLEGTLNYKKILNN